MVLATALVAFALVAMGQDACSVDSGRETGDSSAIDPTPQTLDGSSSREFEPGDIERAENASPAVQAYCEDAVSEAQRIGCLSHVDPSDVP